MEIRDIERVEYTQTNNPIVEGVDDWTAFITLACGDGTNVEFNAFDEEGGKCGTPGSAIDLAIDYAEDERLRFREGLEGMFRNGVAAQRAQERIEFLRTVRAEKRRVAYREKLVVYTVYTSDVDDEGIDGSDEPLLLNE
jgi:hypothetical protein